MGQSQQGPAMRFSRLLVGLRGLVPPYTCLPQQKRIIIAERGNKVNGTRSGPTASRTHLPADGLINSLNFARVFSTFGIATSRMYDWSRWQAT